jgi:hypothetical protein
LADTAKSGFAIGVDQFGREVDLTPAVILLDQTTGASAWAAANLGYDLMQQARPFTLNFRRMKIESPSPTELFRQRPDGR